MQQGVLSGQTFNLSLPSGIFKRVPCFGICPFLRDLIIDLTLRFYLTCPFGFGDRLNE